MKLVNPLHYPFAVLLGAIILVFGVRLGNFPKVIMLLIAVAIAFLAAALIQTQQLNNPVLDREIKAIEQQAKLLAEQAQNLRTESEQILTSSTQIELLTTIQYACDRALELPAKVEQITSNLQGKDSLLSPADLQRQLAQVKAKQSQSSDVAYQQLEQLATSLERNLELARQGQDTRQAQIFSLSTQVIDAAGVLQKLQNQIRTSNLNNTEELNELRDLSEELKNIQENVDVLIY
jgi:hypothetical protein